MALSITVSPPDTYITGINDVLLLDRIINNTLSLIANNFNNLRGEINIFKVNPNTLSIAIECEIEPQEKATVEQVFSPLIDSNQSDRWFDRNGDIQISAIEKILYLLEGEITISSIRNNKLRVTLKLPLVINY